MHNNPLIDFFLLVHFLLLYLFDKNVSIKIELKGLLLNPMLYWFIRYNGNLKLC